MRPFVGEDCFTNPNLYSYITFVLERLFGDGGSAVTLPDTLTIRPGLVITPKGRARGMMKYVQKK